MEQGKYPKPPSHKTFNFGSIEISSDFDSGNCSHVQKISHTSYQIWIGTDNPKNNYRTWFYFSVLGFNQGTTVNFKIKNMQNQSKLLSEGLVPVFRQQQSSQWKRIKQRVNLNSIVRQYLFQEYNEGWIQWSFKHTFTSSKKVYLAIFYPWSNQQNNKFLGQMQSKAKQLQNCYFYRSSIINTLEGRSLQFLVISSNSNKINKQQKIQDKLLFPNVKKPLIFNQNKKGVVISARVHPGQVPGSHVMNGIIKQLLQNNEKSKILRDNFVFYIFPILNPDGVARGHYRVDTNGVNLNRCYINPNPKLHPTIYAIRNFIYHLNSNNRFFAFLDLHAHASRKGTFIYGNSINQLQKQIQTCLFPKILSMNSADFQYEASNFTQQNMYCKDKADHVSKQGSGRVAIYKATKNPFCWTLQCNYNMSKHHNILQPKKKQNMKPIIPNQNQLNQKLIVTYKNPSQTQSSQFFTIETFNKLGRQICESFLDLIQKNPQSRIQNPYNYFKSVQNLKMYLGIALLRMAPNRFQSHFRKIINSLGSENQQIINRSLKALYFLTIKNAKITNINSFIKEGDFSNLILPQPKKAKSASVAPPRFSSLLQKINPQSEKPRINHEWKSQKNIEKCSIELFEIKPQRRKSLNVQAQKNYLQKQKQKEQQLIELKIQNIISQKLKNYQRQRQFHRVTSFKLQAPKVIGLANLKEHLSQKQRQFSPVKNTKIKFQNTQLPSLRKKNSIIMQFNQMRNVYRGNFVRDPLLFIEAD